MSSYAAVGQPHATAVRGALGLHRAKRGAFATPVARGLEAASAGDGDGLIGHPVCAPSRSGVNAALQTSYTAHSASSSPRNRRSLARNASSPARNGRSSPRIGSSPCRNGLSTGRNAHSTGRTGSSPGRNGLSTARNASSSPRSGLSFSQNASSSTSMTHSDSSTAHSER